MFGTPRVSVQEQQHLSKPSRRHFHSRSSASPCHRRETIKMSPLTRNIAVNFSYKKKNKKPKTHLHFKEKKTVDCHPLHWLPFCFLFSTCPELKATRVGFCQFCATPRPAAASILSPLTHLLPFLSLTPSLHKTKQGAHTVSLLTQLSARTIEREAGGRRYKT